MKKQLSLTLAAAGLAFASQSAMAMTAANTDIINTVTLGYSVGSTAQTNITANATFKVDKLVNYTIAADVTAALTSVTPSQTGVTMFFTVTNTGNAAQDFIFSASDVAYNTGFQINATGTSYTDEVTYDVSGARFYNEADVEITSGAVLNIAALTDQAPSADNNHTIKMVLDMPAAPAQLFNVSSADSVFPTLADVDLDGASDDIKVDTAKLGVTVTAKATNGAGIQISVDKTATNDIAVVDTVLTDAVAALDAGTSYKAEKSTTSGFVFGTAILKLTKTAAAIAMPTGVTGYGNAATIPGATVQYTVTVQNFGSAAASNVTISDDLNIAGTAALDPATATITDATGASSSSVTTGVVSATYANVAAAGNSGDTQTLKFTAKIK